MVAPDDESLLFSDEARVLSLASSFELLHGLDDLNVLRGSEWDLSSTWDQSSSDGLDDRRGALHSDLDVENGESLVEGLESGVGSWTDDVLTFGETKSDTRSYVVVFREPVLKRREER